MMMRVFGTLVAAICCAGAVFGQVPYQVKDLYPGEPGPGFGEFGASSPTLLVVHDGVAYFRTTDANNGVELWRTDGTPDGTRLAVDFTPHFGTRDTFPTPVPLGDRLLVFVHFGSVTYLFASDGRPEGTALVTTMTGRNPVQNALVESFTTVEMGGSAYFWLVDGGAPTLWRTDGTAGGTRSVFRFPALNQFSYGPAELVVVDDAVYFVMNDGVHGWELWRSDGTAEGTRLVRDIVPGTGLPAPRVLCGVAGTLFFVAGPVATGAELWRSDGTEAGTVMVKELVPGTGAAEITEAVALGGRLVFRASTAGTGPELWVSDGTGAGTSALDVVPGSWGLAPDALFVLGDRVYFSAAGAGGRELWRSDGTLAGTVRAAPVGPAAIGSWPWPFASAGGSLYFPAPVGSSGARFFRFDPASGELVDLGPWKSSSGDLRLREAVELDGALVYSVVGAGSSRELYRSDGTAAGTGLLREIHERPVSSNASPSAAVGSRLLFTAWHPEPYRSDLYLTDGTEAGTAVALELRAGTGVGHGVRPLGDRFCVTTTGTFADPNAVNGPADELYVMDLTAEGTTLVASWPTTRQIRGFGGSIEHAGKLLFVRADRLYATDGTAEGTVPLGNGSGYPLNARDFAVSGGWVFFTGRGSSDGLWRTDGTAAGTAAVAPPEPVSSWEPADFTDVGGVLYLRAWVNGTDSVCRVDPGTLRPVVMESRPNWDVEDVVSFNGRAYFVSGPSSGGDVLSVVGDEPGGAALVFQPPAGALFDIRELYAVGSTLYFVASDGVTGFELWRTDGTQEGTSMVADLAPGRASSTPMLMTAVGDGLYFVAHTMEHGAELWRSDGTAAGTEMVGDLAPGPRSAAISRPFVRAGDLLYFNASPGRDGAELWAVRVGCRVDVDGSGRVEIADLFAFVASWFGEGLAADWDGDGSVAAADVFAFLADWFVGC